MATATKSTYKLIKKVKSDKLDVDNLQDYTLMLNIGVRDIQVGIIDNGSNTCLLLEDYILASVRSNEELLSILKEIFEHHHLLTAGFWGKVKVCFKNNKFSQVPATLFVPEALEEYLKINCQVNFVKEEFLYYKSIRSEVVTVFAADRGIYNWINSLYSNTKLGFVHQSCALTEGVLHDNSNYPQDTFYLYIDRFKLHIVTTKGDVLQYYNQFPIKQFSDYIKYITMVMKGLGYDQKTTNVVLWGYIGKQSSHFNEFYKYIKNISFADRSSYLTYDYLFDDLQDHHYFDTYCTYLCE